MSVINLNIDNDNSEKKCSCEEIIANIANRKTERDKRYLSRERCILDVEKKNNKVSHRFSSYFPNYTLYLFLVLSYIFFDNASKAVFYIFRTFILKK